MKLLNGHVPRPCVPTVRVGSCKTKGHDLSTVVAQEVELEVVKPSIALLLSVAISLNTLLERRIGLWRTGIIMISPSQSLPLRFLYLVPLSGVQPEDFLPSGVQILHKPVHDTKDFDDFVFGNHLDSKSKCKNSSQEQVATQSSNFGTKTANSCAVAEETAEKETALPTGTSQLTLSHEIRRNGIESEKYLRNKTYGTAMARRRCTTENSRKDSVVVWEALDYMRREDWSPKQVVGYMKRKGRLISHGLTCRYVRTDESGEPVGHCLHGMKYGRHGRPDCTTKVGNIPSHISIHDRPEKADGRLKFPIRSATVFSSFLYR